MPAFNEERHIEASVRAMQAQRFGGTLEFLIADGGSTDGTVEIVRRLAQDDPRIRLLENPRRTTPSGLNVALAHARGQWVARMDAHARYPPDYLQRGVDRLRQGDTRWVSGLAIATGEGPISRAVALALRLPLGRGGSRKWVAKEGTEREYELDSGVFAGVWERQTLLEYGGWDERWARNQDSEMAGRFLANGERLILVPAMAAEYAPRDSLPGLARQYFQYGVYRARTARRHPVTMRRSHVLAPGIVVTLAAAALARGTVRSVARAGVGGYAVALVATATSARSHTDRRLEAALVPVVCATMHLAYGIGAWVEAVRGGPPVAALAQVLRLDGMSRRLSRPASEVYAPSLHEALACRR